MSGIPKVILSHKRAETITTHRLVADAVVCIPESQEEEYRKVHPDMKIVTHPDSVKGISPKRQWVYEKYGDVFMLDDDCNSISRVYIRPDEKNYKVSPEVISMWIDDLYYLAKANGFKMFGFNRMANPMGFTGKRAFNLSDFIQGAAMGLIEDDKLYFPNDPDMIAEDIFICGLNSYHYRKCFIDLRVAFGFKDTGRNMGGCADFRTSEGRKKTFIQMRKLFGDSIVHQKKTPIKSKVDQWEFWLNPPF